MGARRATQALTARSLSVRGSSGKGQGHNRGWPFIPAVPGGANGTSGPCQNRATCDILCDVKLPYRLVATNHVRLAQSPLKVMLGQVRYPAILALSDANYLAPLQEALRSEYPDFGVEQQVGLQVGERGVLRTEESKQWKLSSSDGIWSVVVGQSSLVLQSSSSDYTDYAEFRERFATVWSSALALLRPGRRVQQGLRYVNHIEGERSGQEWARIVNPELLGAIGTGRFDGDIEQSVAELVLRRPDGQLKIKHGVVRAGPEARIGYLLDFDYVTQDRPDALGEKSVLEQFDAFHHLIYALFRWSVTAEAFESFVPEGEHNLDLLDTRS